ncbi:GNAT family N-acetyltransferase [Nonomuraea sp. WAC 01424]|uniref:GNAT family N-acetyltransferase n=1 Tax=Nonomuraea sp. WAC 01424 TaxID=2203200 RepID=UPI000F76C02E|nr:GNAT family N-acetyltransferase [Nonomuraea sp. WAC 01424]RSN05887.1 GNAT family N-acetyltransferase [Nonomuraea sp. WAC 01424]
MLIRSFPEPDIPSDLLVQVRDLQQEAWPAHTAPAGGPVHDPALSPRSMLLLDEDTVVAALDILSKPVTHAGRRFRAAGLSTVVTRKASRGRGHGRHLVRAAHEAIAAAGFDVALFTCDRPLQGFYESAGWQVIPGAVLVGGTPQAPFPSDLPGFDKVTMGDFLSPQGRAHRLSFHHARIDLYPGEIDRLW